MNHYGTVKLMSNITGRGILSSWSHVGIRSIDNHESRPGVPDNVHSYQLVARVLHLYSLLRTERGRARGLGKVITLQMPHNNDVFQISGVIKATVYSGINLVLS